jgi:Na+-transporting NADH:ubiquinone oxidoreductase subunit NqrC
MKKVVIWIVALLCVAVVCGGFYLVKVRSEQNQAKDKTELTEVQKIITKDLEKNYPATPREVVKFYNRIITAYYKETYSDEELDQMADQVLALFDDDLLANNPKDTYLADVKADIADYQSRSRYIASSNVCESDEVGYKQDGDDSLAYVLASYFVREKNTFTWTYQQYVLRQDAEGNWKILTFYQVEGDSSKGDD